MYSTLPNFLHFVSLVAAEDEAAVGFLAAAPVAVSSLSCEFMLFMNAIDFNWDSSIASFSLLNA